MKLSKDLCRYAIQIDRQAEPSFGSDQAYETYPVRFPTVDVPLTDTFELVGLADQVRVEAGYKPMCPTNERSVDECDIKGWYEFHVGLNGYTESGVDTCLTFMVIDSDSDDNEQVYSLDLDDVTQAEVRAVLDEQLMDLFGVDCNGLLRRGAEMVSKGA